MRLKSIKLAGFKSFVDPTTVPFPSNMTAVVGPNGCGKSNIIDAVRWVMGESSAKFLRGESMADVIFNGSSARKPVGQASIELVFDNSDGTAPGEHARFNEISVRRRVSREGQSDYFLNGAKCRRRDITDLFLGTGLGPRSYAIIEQGMISRLIEAKPEELRVYIEEAAGISKYKERRRDTENRIRRTQENLERLTDLRDELERQLQHLQRQAQAAEKYKALKQEERELKAQLSALRWQALDNELQASRGQIRDTELELEKLLSERVSLETGLESLRDDHQQRSEHFSRAQARYYEAGADIARVEQSLDNQRERSRQTAMELDQALANQRELSDEVSQDQQRLEQIDGELAELEPEQETRSARSEESGDRLADAEHAMSDWQQRWEAFSARSSDARRNAELAQGRIRATEDTIERLQSRRERLDDEREVLEAQLDRSQLADLEEQESMLSERRDTAAEKIDALQDELHQARAQQRQSEAEVSEQRQSVQTLRASLESQQTLLEEQLGSHDDELQDWLSHHQLQAQPRITRSLVIEAGWEFAVGQLLGSLAQGLAVNDASELAGALSRAPRGLALIDQTSRATSRAQPDSLLSKVSGAGGLSSLLAGVRTTADMVSALEKRPHLQEGESLLTRDGVWLGAGWLRMPASGAGHVGVIERQQQVDQLQGELADAEAGLERSGAALAALEEQSGRASQTLENERRTLSDDDQELASLRSRISGIRGRAEQIESRLELLQEDLEEVREQWQSEQDTLAEVRHQWQDALTATEENDEEKEILLQDRDSLRENLDHLRQQARHDRDHAHHLQLQLQTLHSQRDGLRQTLARMQLQRERLQERVSVLQEGRENAEAPIEDLKMQLEGLLDRRLAEEEKLTAARDALEDIDRQVREKEQGRARVEQSVQDVRARLEARKMESQALEIRSSNHIEQLDELGVNLREVLENIPEHAEASAWSDELEKLAGRLQRLGAINLAAIEEYQVQSERKTYLDSQHEDLTEALDILDNAIRKIDRETRQRFRETFDRVNAGLQALFPKVFGGGNAYLELTGEDLLETGVAIMARPPGKKNSTIHLLSGGEKALTAIALVFSIFQLNPAPFCMLDEVDAPLDDANVTRYANMVKEMASQVQFIYITHNKIAMEMAHQLMGVTMHEPGCSRLVSVDVEKAAALADA